MSEAIDRVRGLSFWAGPVDPAPIGGGITNRNFLVEDAGKKFVVRMGEDIPAHNIMRFNELAAARAAEAASVSPAVRHVEPGLMVIDFIEAKTFSEADVRAELPRVVELLKRSHREVTRRLEGPALGFWVFHILRNYIHWLGARDLRSATELARYSAVTEQLEKTLGPTEIVFAHNDLLPANFLDDGARLWLIDWDYAGFNTPMFDLGGLASNNSLDAAERDRMLALYFDREPDDAMRLKLQAMVVASLLRESLWSMVSETTSDIEFDYRAYTAENLSRFDRAIGEFETMGA